jgi:hypothetical protein
MFPLELRPRIRVSTLMGLTSLTIVQKRGCSMTTMRMCSTPIIREALEAEERNGGCMM